jgi:hypothetical protein
MKTFCFLLLLLLVQSFLRKMHGFISMLNPILSRTLTRLKYAFKRALDKEEQIKI